MQESRFNFKDAEIENPSIQGTVPIASEVGVLIHMKDLG